MDERSTLIDIKRSLFNDKTLLNQKQKNSKKRKSL